jgi:hypothetical protein
MDNEGMKALALLERIASAVEFLAGQHGHVPSAPAQSPAESEQPDAAKQESSV